MIQRNIAGRPQPRQRAARPAPSRRSPPTRRSRGPRTTRSTPSRALALRTSLDGTQQYQRNIEDAQGWQETAEQALNTITEADPPRARARSSQGATDTTDADAARGDRARDRPAHRERQAEREHDLPRPLRLLRHDDRRRRPTATTDAYAGSATDIARQIGPGVAITLTLVGSTVLGGGQAAADGKPLHVLRDIADHLRADDGAALRGRPRPARAQPRRPARRPRAQRRPPEPARGGLQPPRRDRGVDGQAALEHRGRRHRQDPHRAQLPAGRLPGRAQGRGEHRADLAHGLPPLGATDPTRKEIPFP